MAKVGCVPNTLRQNRTVKCKERPVGHKHTTLVHENNPNQYFSAPEEFFFKGLKTHLLNLPQSANAVVKMTGLPDFAR